jgi:hypothetical protein
MRESLTEEGSGVLSLKFGAKGFYLWTQDFRLKTPESTEMGYGWGRFDRKRHYASDKFRRFPGEA